MIDNNNLPSFFQNHKERARVNLISDYGKAIDSYLKKMEELNRIDANHMNCHKINGVYRAKMVDWMVEVLTAFKCAD